MKYNRTTGKLQRLSTLAIAAATAAALSAGVARAAVYSLEDTTNDDWIKRVDLGIDISDVVRTRAGVHSYLASLPAETLRVIMTTCEHYMEQPAGLKSVDTIPFCRIAVEG